LKITAEEKKEEEKKTVTKEKGGEGKIL